MKMLRLFHGYALSSSRQRQCHIIRVVMRMNISAATNKMAYLRFVSRFHGSGRWYIFVFLTPSRLQRSFDFSRADTNVGIGMLLSRFEQRDTLFRKDSSREKKLINQRKSPVLNFLIFIRQKFLYPRQGSAVGNRT